MWRNLKLKLYHKKVLNAQTVTASQNSDAVDTQDLLALAFLVQFGAFTFTGTNKIDIKLQHSDDNSTWVDVGAENIYEGVAPVVKSCVVAADGDKSHLIEYRSGKRYVRCALVVGGTVSVAAAVVAISNKPELMPPNL